MDLGHIYLPTPILVPAASFIAQIPDQHQAGRQGIEAMQKPDWPQGQAGHVKPKDEIAAVAQADVRQAV